MYATQSDNYLGIEFSTQQLKAVVINDSLEVIHQSVVQFDSDLPEFRTHGGVHSNEDSFCVTAPTIMWVKALDMILERLKLEGLDFSTVSAISGAAQQHGSVYWKRGASEILINISPNKFLHEQLQSCFSIRDSPVWMDSSTQVQCKVLENHVGGALALANITGSRAYERFTGNQIAKIFQTRPEAYNNTERITLVSNFGATLFLGKYAAIDLADGSGMNLLDIHSKKWSQICLEPCGTNLEDKLGFPVPSTTLLGSISNYFVERYGFSPDCKVVAFTGDNPASLVGLRLRKNDVAVSLGTSDTVFLWITDPKPSLESHIFCNPLNTDDYMALLCFKNGSLTRERIRDECAESSWQLFDDILESTPRGNFGNIGIYFDHMEILPRAIGDYRYNKNNEMVQRFSKEVEVRACVEGQFLAKRIHAENLGFHIGTCTRVLATGGASINKSLMQVLSDIFNRPVYISNTVNSACLGSALLAKYVASKQVECFENSSVPEVFHLAAEPSKDATQVYGSMLARYRVLEEKIRNAELH